MKNTYFFTLTLVLIVVCRISMKGTPPLIEEYLLLILLAIASYYDLKYKIIPDTLIIVSVICSILFGLLNIDTFLSHRLLSGLVVLGIMTMIYFLTKGNIGFGDVKLIATTALFLGLWRSFLMLLIATFFCGLFGLILLATKRVSRKSSLAFAPFILIATIITVFYQ
ncbi:prepilin peptidase [Alkaliphilus pronyensis]|uniref:Prepilin peptidase n=1 Tax=Alkaliphilus pronyensis TaxID=1482732 RepID=A0A6I0F5T1_9FIRM|nr:A24 family peptidase [Alkaliphilus pronyensis]KAB3537235.1 prepilin peptidase [Alkaliphilus pronyensis]